MYIIQVLSQNISDLFIEHLAHLFCSWHNVSLNISNFIFNIFLTEGSRVSSLLLQPKADAVQ